MTSSRASPPVPRPLRNARPSTGSMISTRPGVPGSCMGTATAGSVKTMDVLPLVKVATTASPLEPAFMAARMASWSP